MVPLGFDRAEPAAGNTSGLGFPEEDTWTVALLADEAVQEPLRVSWPREQGSISDCLGGPGR